MNSNQSALIKIMRFSQIYEIQKDQIIYALLQNWDLIILNEQILEIQILSTEEALTQIYSKNSLLFLTENEILEILAQGLVDNYHIDPQLIQIWFEKNFKQEYMELIPTLDQVIKIQLNDKQITIQDVQQDIQKPFQKVFRNIYYNREGQEFAQSLK